jgi:hypothetical protein
VSHDRQESILSLGKPNWPGRHTWEVAV